jgi:hypothetical protein
VQHLIYIPFLHRGSFKNEGCQVFGLHSNEPRRVPKRQNFVVANGDCGASVEEIHVNRFACVDHSFLGPAIQTKVNLNEEPLQFFQGAEFPNHQDEWAYTPFPNLACTCLQ